MEINAIPRRLAFTAGGQQLINWGSLLYARHLCRGYRRRQRMVLAADLSRPDACDADDGRCLPVRCRAAGSLWRKTGGHQRYLTDSRQLRHDGWRPSLAGWYGARLLTGIGMRLSLYDALFAAVVNLYGQQARKTISHITLAGGLASALFWPLGEALLTIMPAECPADLCAVWPAERMAELSTASPAAQFSGEITSLASDSRGRPA